MRAYNSSVLRIGVLAVMLLAMASMSSMSLADTAAPGNSTGADAAAAPVRGKGVVSLILDNLDPIFFVIGGLSIAGLTFILQGFIKNRRSVYMPEGTIRQIREMIAARRFKDLIDFTESDPTFISKSLNPALKRAPDFTAMKESMETAVAEQTADQFRRIEYLNVIGNLGPLLGLLGTVWGMIVAFSDMNAAGGNATPAQLAGGVSKALAHTFLGLMLAVPCLAAFGILRTIIDRLTTQGALLAEELLLLIKPGDARATPAPARPAAVPSPVPASPVPARKPAGPAAPAAGGTGSTVEG